MRVGPASRENVSCAIRDPDEVATAIAKPAIGQKSYSSPIEIEHFT
jgi:hypothetical protein